MARRLSSVCVCVCVCLSVNFFAGIATTTPKIARSLPNVHRMVSTWARIHVVLKVEVKVKGHVIRALLCRSRKSLLVAGKCRIATKLAHDGPQVRLHPGCAQGQGQGSRARGSFVLARKTLLLRGKWPDCDQTCTRWSPGQRAYRMCPVSRSRSKVT